MLAHTVEYKSITDPHPYSVLAWGNSSSTSSIFVDESEAVSFGFVYSGTANISREVSDRNFESYLSEGMWFSCPGKFQIEGGSGLIVKTNNRRRVKNSFFTMGGPMEQNEKNEYIGNLPYIDGCSDSILIHPTLLGAPCLNHLHFPKNIKQTQHTHPSGRAGIVFKGNGTCVVVEEKSKQVIRYPLRPGMIFVIPKDAPHAFETNGKATLDVIAFHPDSDYGPTARNHPMINRTIVDGVSASTIPSIQTSPDF